jgi:hypothetical protein
VASIRKVHAQTGLHLGNLLSSEEVIKLQNDDLLLGEVLWHLVKDQASEQQIDRDGFESALSGRVILDATDALLEEFLDFLSDGRRAEILRLLLKQFEATKDLALATAKSVVTAEPTS